MREFAGWGRGALLLVARLPPGTRWLRGSASPHGHLLHARPFDPHRRAGGACKTVRPQAEPGYEEIVPNSLEPSARRSPLMFALLLAASLAPSAEPSVKIEPAKDPLKVRVVAV